MDLHIADTGTAADIAAAIRLAIAPIFLLVAMGAFLNVMTQRLGRIVDRARTLETLIDTTDQTVDQHREELHILEGRMVASNWAIVACGFSSMLVCVMVGIFFCGALFDWPIKFPVAALFLIVVAALIVGLSFFLYEISLASRALHVRKDILRPPKVD